MTDFIIKAPNGKRYKVTGDTPEGALAALKKHVGAAGWADPLPHPGQSTAPNSVGRPGMDYPIQPPEIPGEEGIAKTWPMPTTKPDPFKPDAPPALPGLPNIGAADAAPMIAPNVDTTAPMSPTDTQRALMDALLPAYQQRVPRETRTEAYPDPMGIDLAKAQAAQLAQSEIAAALTGKPAAPAKRGTPAKAPNRADVAGGYRAGDDPLAAAVESFASSKGAPGQAPNRAEVDPSQIDMGKLGSTLAVVPRGIASALPAMSSGVNNILGAAAALPGENPVSDWLLNAAKVNDAQTAAVAGPADSWAAQQFQGAAQSLGAMVPGLAASVMSGGAATPGVMAAYLAPGAITQGGQSVGAALDAGKGPARALLYGGTDAAAEVLFERIPVGALLGDIAHGTGLGKMIVHQLSTEVPTEVLTTLFQDLNAYVTLNPEKSVADFLKEQPPAIRDTIAQTVLMSAGVGLGGAAVSAATRNKPSGAPSEPPAQPGPAPLPLTPDMRVPAQPGPAKPVQDIAATMAPSRPPVAPMPPDEPKAPESDIAAAMTPPATALAAQAAPAPAGQAPAPAKGITRAEAEANPQRYEIMPTATGTGSDTAFDGGEVAMDRETGRPLPIIAPTAQAPNQDPGQTGQEPQADVPKMGTGAEPAAPTIPAPEVTPQQQIAAAMTGKPAQPAAKVPEAAPQPIAPAKPAPAPQQAAPQAPAPEAARPVMPKRDIKRDEAVTPTGSLKVGVTYAVTDLSKLTPSNMPDGRVNPAYPQERQPRDRTGKDTQLQIQNIFSNFDPRQLDQTPTTGDGAPIVDKAGVVDSGNGRAMMLARMYAERPDLAAKYVDHLKAQGYPVDGIKNPVLVRVRDDLTPEQIQTLAKDSNTDSKLAMSTTEQAMSDGKILSDGALSLYRGGDIDSAANSDFRRAFIKDVVPPNEQKTMQDATGNISQDGMRRMQAALLARAYGDAALVSKLMDSAENNIKAIGGAVLDMAPMWAKMRKEAAAGAIAPEMDQTEALLEAIRLVDRARTAGRNVIEFVKQPDLLSGDGISPMGQCFLALFYRDTTQWTKPAGRDRIVEALTFYVDEAMKTAPGADMFGASADPAAILALARKKQDAGQPDPTAQTDLFAKPAGGDGAGVRPAGGDGAGPGQQGATGQVGGQRPESGQQGAVKGPERPAAARPAAAKVDYPNRKLGMRYAKADDPVGGIGDMSDESLGAVALSNAKPGDIIPQVGNMPHGTVEGVSDKTLAIKQADGSIKRISAKSEGFTRLARELGSLIAGSNHLRPESLGSLMDMIERDPAFTYKDQVAQLIDDQSLHGTKDRPYRPGLGRPLAPAAKPAAPQTGKDIAAQSEMRIASYGGEGAQYKNGRSVRLIDRPAYDNLMSDIAAAKGMDARIEVARDWVRTQGKKAKVEFMVILDTDGVPVSVTKGQFAGVTWNDAVRPMLKDGKIAIAIHNHPRSTPFSAPDLSLGQVFPRIEAVPNDGGDIHVATAGPHSPKITMEDYGRVTDFQTALTKIYGKSSLEIGQPVFDIAHNETLATKVGAAGFTMTVARLGLITYTGPAQAILDEHGVDFDAFFDKNRSAFASILGRAGFDVAPVGSASGAGRNEGAQPGKSARNESGGGQDQVPGMAPSANDGSGRVPTEGVTAGPDPIEAFGFKPVAAVPGRYVRVFDKDQGDGILVNVSSTDSGYGVSATNRRNMGQVGSIPSRELIAKAPLDKAMQALRDYLDEVKSVEKLDRAAPRAEPPKVEPPKSNYDNALDALFGPEGNDVSGTGGNLERDRGDAAPSDGMGQEDVSSAAGPDGGRGQRGDRAGQSGDGEPASGGGLGGDDAASVGTGGDSGVGGGKRAPRKPAAGGNGGRRAGGGKGGLSPDAAGNGATSGTAPERTGLKPSKKDDANDLNNLFGEGVAEFREDSALPEGVDPRKYEKAASIFERNLEDVDTENLSDTEAFVAMLRPLLAQGLTRAAAKGMEPYALHYLAQRRLGRTTPADLPTKPTDAPAEDRAARQAKADRIKPILGDEANIRATLPLLLPVQQDDILKIETRFAKPDGHGMLITNGTGTGKTYTGAGLVKRFVQSGKENVLIIGPNKAVLMGWQRTLTDLGVPSSFLENTKDAGRGVVMTTYQNIGKNNDLAKRQWDLIVPDEAQNLSQNESGKSTTYLQTLRAISHHPDGLADKSRMLRADEWARMESLPKQDRRRVEMYGDLMAKQQNDVKRMTGEPRSKVLMLSATPFARDMNTDMAAGYLFDYPPDGYVGQSRQPGRNLFMVKNFGYRIRSHRLTKPESAVDSGIFERDFFEDIKREGVLSGRSLQIDVDYDRKFALVHDAIGERLDQIIKVLEDGKYSEDKELAKGYSILNDEFRRSFKYHQRMQLLEAIKARAAIPDIQKHLAMGRKIVVFHDFNKGGGIHPFASFGKYMVHNAVGPSFEVDRIDMDPNAKAALEDFAAKVPDYDKLDFASYDAPVVALKAAFGKRAALFNGTIPEKKRLQSLEDFNRDGSGMDILVVQADAGGAGISMHDTTGKHQRVLINLGMPTKPTAVLQQEGRILRIGTTTNAPFRYYTIGTNWERTAFAHTIAQRSEAVENLALGNEARSLMTSFIDAYNDAAPMSPSAEDGKGGKERDRRQVMANPYEVAKTHYFGRPKIIGNRNQRDGVDFYPTPEPLGLKMVQWAGIRRNERVLEPSAGDGAIARYMPDGIALTMVEPSSDLASRAQLRAPGAKVEATTFENYHIVNKHHVILMNPPFGHGGSTAYQHLEKAMRHLRDGGRIVAIVPTGPAADKRFEALDMKGFALAADITMPAVAFERAGTGVRTRVLILDKTDNPDALEAGTKHINLSSPETINDFFNRLEGISVPERPSPKADVVTELEQEAEAAQGDAAPAKVVRTALPLGAKITFKLGQTKHTKFGYDLFVATAEQRLDDEAYKATKAVAQANGGHYSSWKGPGAVPGFQFKTEAARQAFLDDMAKPTAAPGFEETVYHGTPHDFDRFSLGAMGTGEGAQAFGWGLYFAGAKKLAEYYRNKLSMAKPLLNGQAWPNALTGNLSSQKISAIEDMIKADPIQKPDDVSDEAWRGGKTLAPISLHSTATALRDKLQYSPGDDPKERLAIYRNTALGQYTSAVERDYPPGQQEGAAKLAAIDWLSERVSKSGGGRLFTAEVPDADVLLDWDKPLAEQPEKVREAMRDLMPDLFGTDAKSEWQEQPETKVTRRAYVDQFGWQIVDFGTFFAVNSPAGKITGGRTIAEHKKLADAKASAVNARKHYAADRDGQDAYRMLSGAMQGDRGASQALLAAGIPGLRYLDGRSRSAGEGTHNYVIWDEGAIQVISKEQRQTMAAEASAATMEITRLMPKLRAELDRLDLGRVKLSQATGAWWQGQFSITGDGAMEIVIGASLDPMKTLHHEVIHALRAMNLFTPKEWAALEDAARRSWYKKHRIQERYSSAPKPGDGPRPLSHMLTAEQELEEAIAEEFAAAMAEKKAPPTSTLIRAFNKIARFFRAVRNVFNGAGFQTPEDIFGRVLSGEISKRQAGNTGAGVMRQEQPKHPIKITEDKHTVTFSIRIGGNEATMVAYKGDPGDPFALQVDVTEVPKSMQRQGVSTALHDAGIAWAKSHGGDFLSGYELTKDGKAFYEGLRKKGYGVELIDLPNGESAYRLSLPNLGFAESKLQRPMAIRALSPAGRAAKNTGMMGAIFIPDRRVWEEITRNGAPVWDRLRGGLGGMHDAIDRARVKLQNAFLPFLRAQQAVELAIGRPLGDEHNAFLSQKTFSGRVAKHFFDIDHQFTKPIVDLIAATKGDLTFDDVGTWLYARHAIERNDRIADINPNMPDAGSGMESNEASMILAAAAAGPHAATLDKIGDLVDALRKKTMALRVDTGLVTKDQADLWDKMYDHYVPLKGFADNDHGEAILDVAGIGRRFNVRGAESKRALGRKSEAFNPLQAAITQAQEVAIRAEKNRVGNAVYELARDFPSDALWSVKKPATKRYFNKTTGMVETRVEDPVSLIMDPNEMAVKVDGVEHRILFHDERLAEAAGTVGADKMGSFMRILSTAMMFWRAVRTSLSPAFVMKNAIRDAIFSQINLHAIAGADAGRIGRAAVKNWPFALAGVYRGQAGHTDTQWSRFYDEFQTSGAKVSFWKMEDPSRAADDMQHRIRLSTGNIAMRAAKTMTSPRALFSNRDNPVLAFTERVNTAVENATRLAVYVEARRLGWTKMKAAALARDVTLDFNQRGSWGAVLNTFYGFFNAGVQGTYTIVNALGSAKVRRISGALIAGGFLMGMLNANLSAMDPDGVLAYDKIPDYQNQMSLQVMLGKGSDSAAALPLPYGFNIFPYMGQQAEKVHRGVKSEGEAMKDVALAAMSAFSPVGGGDFFSTIMPTMLDPMLDLSRNRDWLMRPIKPDNSFDRRPESQKYFSTATEASKALAAGMNAATGGTSGLSGSVDISPEYLDYVAAFVTGSAGSFWGQSVDVATKALTGNFEGIETGSIPIVKDYVHTTPDYLDQTRYFDFRDQIDAAVYAVKTSAKTGEPLPEAIKKWASLAAPLKAAEKLRKDGDETVYLKFNKKVTETMGVIGE